MSRRGALSALLTAAALATTAGAVLAQAPPPGGGPGGPRPGGFGGFGGFGGGGLAGLAMIPEVQKELKLDEAQIDFIEGMRPQRGPGGFGAPPPGGQPGAQPRSGGVAPAPGGPGGFNFDEFRKRMEEQRIQQDKQLAEILDAKQMARLKQLDLQRTGIRALDRKDVQDGLKLTPDQRKSVTDSLTSEREGTMKLFQSAPRPEPGQFPDPAQFQKTMQQMQEMRTATDTKLTKILTPAQSKQWTALQGTPFKFPQPRFPGFPGAPGAPRTAPAPGV
jgi:hypothetical protein